MRTLICLLIIIAICYCTLGSHSKGRKKKYKALQNLNKYSKYISKYKKYVPKYKKKYVPKYKKKYVPKYKKKNVSKYKKYVSKYVQKCKKLQKIKNGELSITKYHHRYVLGEVKCNPGFENYGGSNYICYKGKWSSKDKKKAYCVKVCSQSLDIMNGVLSISNYNPKYSEGEVICNTGFENHGGSNYVCYKGRWKSRDGRDSYCVDIDECATDNGDCPEECENTVGSFRCSCPCGFQLNVNGTACEENP